ncbi:MAG: phosphoribosylaminoimidazolesuccinocarboxamide synthase [Candidatus Pacebacteria bacterium]|nr:phosphoribosylaminoimidazolesuccinocarboxamide synthase [Candidatus Paceibacterota bacterium]MBP9715659.1 phosphoribosylaminoimidazolesuccinocarboxamide synthase [Candidatus Paceibacterota bacterium]
MIKIEKQLPFFDQVEKELTVLDYKLVHRGKVRDIYTHRCPEGNESLLALTTDRISAFDVVSKQEIPYKGQILNMIAAFFLFKVKAEGICPVWLQDTPNQNTSIGVKCTPLKLEMVIRRYLTGTNIWEKYKNGQRNFCGIILPDGMYENQMFDVPIITPTTKAEEGHDENISPEEAIAMGLVTEDQYSAMEGYTRAIFDLGEKHAIKNDLILVDTKYEFGADPSGAVMLMDEVHTPDSSRYWELVGHYTRNRNSEPPVQLSKEFLREWLVGQGFKGMQDQVFPVMPQEVIDEVSNRYIGLYERITGQKFVPENISVHEFVDRIIAA